MRGWSRRGSGWDPRAGLGRWERGSSISPVLPCANQTHALGWKNLISAKSRSPLGWLCHCIPVDQRLPSRPRVPGVTGHRALGFSAVCKLHAINFSGAVLVGDARLWRAGEEEAFCSRAVVAGAGPGCPAPAALPEDNEPLLEAAVSLPHGGMSPRNVVDGSSLIKRIQRGVQLAAISRQRGLSPVLFQGAPPRPPSPHSLGQRMLLAALGLLSPLPSIPNPASHRPPRVCAVSPSPTKPGTVSAGSGETHRVPTRRQAACQSVPPASALAESPARYSPHKGPIFLWFCSAGVTGSNPAAPRAPTLKPGPWTKNLHCHKPSSLFCMNVKRSFCIVRKRKGGCTNPAVNAPMTAAMKCKARDDARQGGAKLQSLAP